MFADCFSTMFAYPTMCAYSFATMLAYCLPTMSAQECAALGAKDCLGSGPAVAQVVSLHSERPNRQGRAVDGLLGLSRPWGQQLCKGRGESSPFLSPACPTTVHPLRAPLKRVRCHFLSSAVGTDNTVQQSGTQPCCPAWFFFQLGGHAELCVQGPLQPVKELPELEVLHTQEGIQNEQCRLAIPPEMCGSSHRVQLEWPPFQSKDETGMCGSGHRVNLECAVPVTVLV